MAIRIYSLPCNRVGRNIVALLLQNPSVKVIKLSARRQCLQIAVSDGYQIVDRVLTRFGLR